MPVEQEVFRTQTSLLKDAVIHLYDAGYSEATIVSMAKKLAGLGPRTLERQRVEIRRLFGQRLELGQTWLRLKQSTVNRWLRLARERDPDLEIRHVLAKRKWRPGAYTNWQPTGPFHIGSTYDPITDTMYLGPGVREVHSQPRQSYPRVVKSSGEKEEAEIREGPLWQAFTLAILKKKFEYSYRELSALSRGRSTRRAEVDLLPDVKDYLKHLQPVTYSKARRLVLDFLDHRQLIRGE